MSPSLSQAHGRPVTVEITIQGRESTLSGTGRYTNGCLLIDIQDPEGDFTLTLDESKWDGEIVHAAEHNSYIIRLRSGKL